MFLDEKPFIWMWRPFYRRYGQTIRRLRANFTKDDYSPALAALQALLQQQNQKLDEIRALLTHAEDQISGVRGDVAAAQAAQLAHMERELASVRGEIGAQTAHINAVHTAQWAAIEQLLISTIGTLSPSSFGPYPLLEQRPERAQAVPRHQSSLA